MPCVSLRGWESRAASLQEPCGWGGRPGTTPGRSVLIRDRSSGSGGEGPGGAPLGFLVFLLSLIQETLMHHFQNSEPPLL